MPPAWRGFRPPRSPPMSTMVSSRMSWGRVMSAGRSATGSFGLAGLVGRAPGPAACGRGYSAVLSGSRVPAAGALACARGVPPVSSGSTPSARGASGAAAPGAELARSAWRGFRPPRRPPMSTMVSSRMSCGRVTAGGGSFGALARVAGAWTAVGRAGEGRLDNGRGVAGPGRTAPRSDPGAMPASAGASSPASAGAVLAGAVSAGASAAELPANGSTSAPLVSVCVLPWLARRAAASG